MSSTGQQTPDTAWTMHIPATDDIYPGTRRDWETSMFPPSIMAKMKFKL